LSSTKLPLADRSRIPVHSAETAFDAASDRFAEAEQASTQPCRANQKGRNGMHPADAWVVFARRIFCLLRGCHCVTGLLWSRPGSDGWLIHRADCGTHGPSSQALILPCGSLQT
jgi:hypothetical protein